MQTDHTTTPAVAHTAPQHLADEPEPAFIRRLLIALTLAVLAVAVVANGAAYLGGVAFAQNVMQLSPVTSYVFGGVIELALAVVAAATFIEAYRLQPTAVFRTATWALSGVSGVFGALFEIMEYLSGHLTLSAAVASAGWRIFAPFLAAGLWELVIHLFCGRRHRAHRARERRHVLLYAFFKAGEAEGLAHGTWRAPVAAARARGAARRIAKHVPREERDAELGAWLASAQYGEHVRVSVAAIAARTAHKMRGNLIEHDAPVQAETAAPEPVAVLQVEDVQEVQPEIAADLQPETPAIRAVDAAPLVQSAPASKKAAINARREIVRAFLQNNRAATGDAVHKALLAAGHDVQIRTAYNDRDMVLGQMT